MSISFLPLKKIYKGVCSDKLQKLLLEKLSSLVELEKVSLVNRDGVWGFLCSYDATNYSQYKISSTLRRACLAIMKNYKHKKYFITAMQSIDCGVLLERHLGNIAGVYAVNISYSGRSLVIEYAKNIVSNTNILAVINSLGYDVSSKKISYYKKNREIIFSILSGLWLALAILLPLVVQLSYSNVCLFLAYCFGLYYPALHSFATLRRLKIDIDVLMVLAALGAAIIGSAAEGALLLFLFSLGHGLEHKAMARAKNALTSLVSLAPKTATLVNSAGVHIITAVASLKVGDEVLVKAGASIPCDGQVVAGASMVNQAQITGESLAVMKTVKDTVYATSLNDTGALTIRVTKLHQDSTVNRMLEMILAANAEKSYTHNFTERFTSFFVPLVLFVVVLVACLPPLILGQPWGMAFYSAMLLLVAASPCALVIGTPAAVLSALACSAKFGVLIKGGILLERLSVINILAVDKTGTLTYGEPELADIIVLSTIAKERLLVLAASVESYSSHPLAACLVSAAADLPLLPADNIREVIGSGIRAEVDGQEVAIGNMSMFIDIPADIIAIYNSYVALGCSVILLSFAGTFVGLFTVSDKLRPGIKSFLTCLRATGIDKIVMLTGDNKVVAQQVANTVGIDDVYAENLPEDKLIHIQALQRLSNSRVAMLGDGVNDAPAMAGSLLGIAMGGAGSDTALEVADVVLMQDDLSKLPLAFALGKQATLIIKQNICLALFSIIFLVITAIFGGLSLSMTVLLHEGTSVLVVLNGLRLLSFR